MNVQVLAIIGSVLTIIIGLWKYTKAKQKQRAEKAGAANNEIKQGVDCGDPNLINSGHSDLNRMRKS